MKRIGLIGGMSWESSAHYYRLINELVRDRLGGLHSAECLMLSVDSAEVEAMQASGRRGRRRTAAHGRRPRPRGRRGLRRAVHQHHAQGCGRVLRRRLRTVAAPRRHHRCTEVVLGCTEIELLTGPEHSPVPVFPTTQLHAEAAVRLALT